MKRTLIALALAIAAGTPAAAADLPRAGQTTKTDSRVAEKAAVLARILNSEAIIIGDAASDAKVFELIPQLLQATPELAELEKKYPGITQDIARAMLPITNRSARERLPQLWERQAALYAASFTLAELDRLIEFYSSTTGVKMIRIMLATNKSKHMVAEAVKSPELKFGASSVLADIRETVPDMLKQLDRQDQAAILALTKTGVMAKLQALAPRTQQIAIDWFAESAPWEDAEIESAMTRIVERRVGAEK